MGLRRTVMTSEPLVSVVVLAESGGVPSAMSLRDALGQRAVTLDIFVPGAMADVDDPRIRPLRVGAAAHPSAMLDATLAAGCAPWLAFVVPGDRWHPDHLSRALAAVDEADADWVYGSRVLLDDRSDVIGLAPAERPERVAAALRQRNAVGGPSSVLCRARVAAVDRPFDTRLRALVHWAAWAVLARRPAAVVAEALVAERADQGPALREPGAAGRDLGVLRADGRLVQAGPAAELDLAAAASALGRRRVAAGVYARSAVRHGRPQDLLRAGRAVGARPRSRPVFAAPGWLSGDRAPARPPPPCDAPTPEVSVIVATRNRAHFLQQAVASALAQEVGLEVVVVDDASDDPDAVAALAFTDPRVRVHRRLEQGGAGRARNDALAIARGPWLAFLDDDDLMAPGRLASHLDSPRTPASAFAGGCSSIPNGGSSVRFRRRGPKAWRSGFGSGA